MTKITTTKTALTAQPKKYTRLILTENKPSWHRLVETHDGYTEYRLGAGKWKSVTPRKFITLVRSAVQAAKSHQIEYLAVEFDSHSFPKLAKQGDVWVARTIAENLSLAAYEFTRYKSKQKDSLELREIVVCGEFHKEATAAFTLGLTVAAGANTTRDIANETASDITPATLGDAAKAALKGTRASVKIFGKAEIKKLKMNLLLAVGQGAMHEPRLIVMEYWGKSKKEAPLVLVGKGITYDTGGLNVKPTGFMHDMHLDMSGGASVIGAMQAIAKAKLKQNVIGIIPAAENAISDRAMRAGDIVTAMNGKTVEILHTDAEGRLVLADALTYAERYKPRMIVDVATLTGAALVALGQHASAFFTKDRKLEDKLRELGEVSGDYVWPLPVWDEYQAHIKSDRADISNIAANFSRYGGAIEGAVFLANFVPKKVPWAHFDIAPRMDSVPQDKLAKGAAGEPVRLLVRLAESL